MHLSVHFTLIVTYSLFSAVHKNSSHHPLERTTHVRNRTWGNYIKNFFRPTKGHTHAGMSYPGFQCPGNELDYICRSSIKTASYEQGWHLRYTYNAMQLMWWQYIYLSLECWRRGLVVGLTNSIASLIGYAIGWFSHLHHVAQVLGSKPTLKSACITWEVLKTSHLTVCATCSVCVCKHVYVYVKLETGLDCKVTPFPT